MKSPNLVVAISGTSGAGKTSLVQKVTEQLDDAISLHFDDYEAVSKYPTDFAQWVSEGADPNKWETPQLLTDLSALRRGNSVISPVSGEILQPAQFIIVEEPFGRERAGIDSLVDLAVCIDLPLEIALARRLLRDAEWCLREKNADYLSIYLKEYLTNYLTNGLREMYAIVNTKVLESCELSLDGCKSLDDLADEVISEIRGRTAYD